MVTQTRLIFAMSVRGLLILLTRLHLIYIKIFLPALVLESWSILRFFKKSLLFYTKSLFKNVSRNLWNLVIFQKNMKGVNITQRTFPLCTLGAIFLRWVINMNIHVTNCRLESTVPTVSSRANVTNMYLHLFIHLFLVHSKMRCPLKNELGRLSKRQRSIFSLYPEIPLQ